MDLDQLQSVRDRERQTDRLQQLRDSFYEDATAFVGDLREERAAAAAEADDPFGAPRVNRLTDRIRTAEQTLEAIYEKRVGKVVKAATFAAADLPAEAEGMTKEEADLFETLVAEIEENRETVLGRLADAGGSSADFDAEKDAPDVGEGAPGAAGEGKPAAADEESPGLGAADVMGEDPTAGGRQPPSPEADEPSAEQSEAPSEETGPGADGTETPEGHDADQPSSGGDEASGDGAVPGEEEANPAETDDETGADLETEADGKAEADVERELVRITDDVGPILGVDEREYDLSADDVVTLPAENARPLVERGAAERLE